MKAGPDVRVFELAPIGIKTKFWIFFIAGIVGVAILIPIGLTTNWWIFLIAAFLTGLASAVTILVTRAPKFEMSSGGLRIRQRLFGRMIPTSQLRLDEAHPVDFAKSPELRPKWRTMGAGLPGYLAGWFRLRNGEKALVFLTHVTSAVYIPTTVGYSLLISPDDPQAFMSGVRALRR